MKDRMSYSIQDQYVVDLTRVDTVVNRGDSDKLNSNFNTSTNKSTTFEVEVELLDPNRHPDDSAELLVSTIRSLLSSAST